MGLEFRPMRLINMACIQSPFIIPLSTVMFAILDNSIFKAQFYILGLMVLFGAWLFLAPLISGQGGRISKAKYGVRKKSMACDAFAVFPGSDYTSPAWSTTIMCFTLAYLLTPKMWNNYDHVPFFYILFGCWILADILVRKQMGCFGDDGFIPGWMGLAFGGAIGFLWFIFVHYIINPDFTFFNEPYGDRLKCNKPKKNHMKCTVYKDGVKVGRIPQENLK